MKKIHINPVARAAGVIGAVVILATSATYALASQATLSNNTINSVTTNLELESSADQDTTFSSQEPGFNFKDIVPGQNESTADSFKIKNTGDVAMLVNVKLSPDAGTLLPAGVTGNDITFHFTHVGDIGTNKSFTWAQLTSSDGETLLDDLATDTTAEYNITVSIADTVTTESVNVGSFDLIFTGTPVATT